jgi:hypothetical protein
VEERGGREGRQAKGDKEERKGERRELDKERGRECGRGASASGSGGSSEGTGGREETRLSAGGHACDGPTGRQEQALQRLQRLRARMCVHVGAIHGLQQVGAVNAAINQKVFSVSNDCVRA